MYKYVSADLPHHFHRHYTALLREREVVTLSTESEGFSAIPSELLATFLVEADFFICASVAVVWPRPLDALLGDALDLRAGPALSASSVLFRLTPFVLPDLELLAASVCVIPLP